jgi:hypothetical protein
LVYSTSYLTHSFAQILFSADNDRLRIQARTKTHRWEILQHGFFRNDFSNTLVEDCVHWFDLESHELEFRPMQDRWRSSALNWKIVFSNGSQHTRPATRVASNEEIEHLVDYQSSAFKMISQRLSSLEKPAFMQIIYVPRTGLAYVTLSRLRLRFTLAVGGELESDDLPSMVVDTSQSVGTFVGLRNQLVLCHKNPALCHQRCVLVPHGNRVQSIRDGGHVQIVIDTSDQTSVRYHRYDVDHDLGRLTSHASLTSRLFKIYLHAITSSCLPDPLTHQTGIEQALWELTSAASYSSMALHESDVNLLMLIGSLTPVHKFYPAHLRCMATTHWNPTLNIISQHSSWAGIVQSILQHSDTLNIFHDSKLDLQDSISQLHRDPHLLKRSFNQSRHMYPADLFVASGVGSFGSMVVKDEVYICRTGDESQLKAATWAVRLAQRRNMHTDHNLVDHLMEHCTSIDDPDHDLQLGYHADWLSLSPSSWLALYDVCRQSNRFGRAGYYRLTFALAALSYSCPEMRSLLPVCIAAACNRRLHEEAPPPWISYELQHGYGPDHSTVVSIIVDQFTLPLPETPAERLERGSQETPMQFRQRQLSSYNTYITSRASELAFGFLDQDQDQPLQLPSLSDNDGPDDEYSLWFDARGCVQAVAEYFTHCAHNADLLDHLTSVQDILQRGKASTKRYLLTFETFETQGLANTVVLDTSTRLIYHGIPLLMDRLALLSNLSLCHASYLSVPQTAPETAFVDLATLIDDLRSGSGVDQIYGSDLMRSLEAAKAQYPTGRPHDVNKGAPELTSLNHLVTVAKEAWQSTLSQLQDGFRIRSNFGDRIDDILESCGLLPRTTLISLLRLLSFHARDPTLAKPRAHIVHLAQCFVLYQHAMRMRNLAVLGHDEELAVERKNWRQEFKDETEDDLLLQVRD